MLSAPSTAAKRESASSDSEYTERAHSHRMNTCRSRAVTFDVSREGLRLDAVRLLFVPSRKCTYSHTVRMRNCAERVLAIQVGESVSRLTATHTRAPRRLNCGSSKQPLACKPRGTPTTTDRAARERDSSLSLIDLRSLQSPVLSRSNGDSNCPNRKKLTRSPSSDYL